MCMKVYAVFALILCYLIAGNILVQLISLLQIRKNVENSVESVKNSL